jgi:hypothetical protein
MLSWITKIKLELMAYGAMFATISPFLVIYDNTSKASIILQKLSKLEPLTFAWMLTIIPTPLRSNFPLFDLLFLCSHIACFFPLWNHYLALVPQCPPLEYNLQKVWNKRAPRKLASPSKHSSKRNVKYKGESRMNHYPYVWYQWRYHM